MFAVGTKNGALDERKAVDDCKKRRMLAEIPVRCAEIVVPETTFELDVVFQDEGRATIGALAIAHHDLRPNDRNRVWSSRSVKDP